MGGSERVMKISLDGLWNVKLADGTQGQMVLPGTLDENNIGHKDFGANQWHPDAALGNADGEVDKDAPIATRFTRRHTYEGEALISRRINIDEYENNRLFVKVERARALRLLVDGIECKPFIQGTLSTPYIFELTGISSGEHEFKFVSDNSYPGMPKDAICYSSAATDETQTNWNGLIGELCMYTKPQDFIAAVRVYPHKKADTNRNSVQNVEMIGTQRIQKVHEKQAGSDFCIDVQVDVASGHGQAGHIELRSEALLHNEIIELTDCDILQENEGTLNQDCENAGYKFGDIKTYKIRTYKFTGLELKDDIRLWDEGEGSLYELTASLELTQSTDECFVSFGVRDFGDDGRGRLALNGRTIFLRSEANCAEYPETGHSPMTVREWRDILGRYKSYGVNCVRFHSHCEPEAAFTAADELGMLLQPELSNWNPKDAFETDESYEYYKAELTGIIKTLANHPSFVMLTLGNELQAKEKGGKRMRRLVQLAKKLDDTRMYADGSNTFYGERGCDEASDFYTSQSCHEVVIRGTFSGMRGYINESYPSADHDYNAAMEKIREQYKKPVFSFEVGQFEVLPDFDELDKFMGVSEPVNLELIKKRVEDRGLLKNWKEYVEATGELSRLAYREEIEAAMRTRKLSGISLLGLQDFPGQGTALVGMMNSHLEPKPFSFAKPEHFSEFFKESMPLVRLQKYTYEAGERLTARVEMANFGKSAVEGEARFSIDLRSCASDRHGCGRHILAGSLGTVSCPAGEYTDVGTIDISLDFIDKSSALTFTVDIGGCTSSYPLWVYAKAAPKCPENVYETRVFDDRTRKILRKGGRVFLAPDADKESMPVSIKTQFTTDFWSVGTFAEQEGGMGQLIDASHPLFRNFPTDKHTDWQWWIMAVKRAIILPRTMKAIVTEMDSYAFLRPMAQLIEFNCMGGKVLLSTMELHKSQMYPEARALLNSIYEYMAGDEFAPQQELTEEEITLDLKLGL